MGRGKGGRRVGINEGVGRVLRGLGEGVRGWETVFIKFDKVFIKFVDREFLSVRVSIFILVILL